MRCPHSTNLLDTRHSKRRCPVAPSFSATTSSSLREIWSDTAVFVDPNDSQALKDELFELIENVPHREVMSRRARERALEFTGDRMGQNYFNAYVELLDAKANQEQEKFAQCA